MARITRPVIGFHLHQPKRRTHYGAWHCRATEETCHQVQVEPSGRLPALFPASIRQKFSGKVQRHIAPCRPHGTREHRNNAHLPSPHQHRATLHRRQGRHMVSDIICSLIIRMRSTILLCSAIGGIGMGVCNSFFLDRLKNACPDLFAIVLQ